MASLTNLQVIVSPIILQNQRIKNFMKWCNLYEAKLNQPVDSMRNASAPSAGYFCISNTIYNIAYAVILFTA